MGGRNTRLDGSEGRSHLYDGIARRYLIAYYCLDVFFYAMVFASSGGIYDDCDDTKTSIYTVLRIRSRPRSFSNFYLYQPRGEKLGAAGSKDGVFGTRNAVEMETERERKVIRKSRYRRKLE